MLEDRLELQPSADTMIVFCQSGEMQCEADGTVVRLEQRGWEKLGARAAEARDGYEGGWTLPLERFVAGAAAG